MLDDCDTLFFAQGIGRWINNHDDNWTVQELRGDKELVLAAVSASHSASNGKSR